MGSGTGACFPALHGMVIPFSRSRRWSVAAEEGEPGRHMRLSPSACCTRLGTFSDFYFPRGQQDGAVLT